MNFLNIRRSPRHFSGARSPTKRTLRPLPSTTVTRMGCGSMSPLLARSARKSVAILRIVASELSNFTSAHVQDCSPLMEPWFTNCKSLATIASIFLWALGVCSSAYIQLA